MGGCNNILIILYKPVLLHVVMSESTEKKRTVIWTDGCFDMMHYGHANALRQVCFSYSPFFFFFVKHHIHIHVFRLKL